MVKRIFSMLLIFIILAACKQSGSTWQEQYDLGVRYLSESNYEEAILAFTAAIEIDPKQPAAYKGAAEAYVALGNRDAALQILENGYKETGVEELHQAWEQIQSEAASDADGDSEDHSTAQLPEPENAAEESYFSNSLAWEEVILGGVPFDECTIETLAGTYDGNFSTNGTTFFAENGPHFTTEPGRRIAMYMNPSTLEFRGITYGMEPRSLLEALGFSEDGLAFAEQCRGSVYVFRDGVCFDAHVDTDLLAGDSYDFAVLLHYSEENAYHMFECCFRDGKLEYIQISTENL